VQYSIPHVLAEVQSRRYFFGSPPAALLTGLPKLPRLPILQTSALRNRRKAVTAQFWALLPLPGGMPTDWSPGRSAVCPPQAGRLWACSMAAARTCPANSALGMPPRATLTAYPDPPRKLQPSPPSPPGVGGLGVRSLTDRAPDPLVIGGHPWAFRRVSPAAWRASMGVPHLFRAPGRVGRESPLSR
jgi:hypothetical protein